VPTPSPESFAALALSSPWLWSSLRFTEGRRMSDGVRELRAWLRRPDLLRVETLDGVLLQVVREHPQRVTALTPEGGYVRGLPWPATVEVPVRRPDGLIAERPDGMSYDAPMYQDYRWVAMLDPVELAADVVVDGVTVVEHGGRPAWEAVVRTTPAYEPRCGCCPLLRSLEVDVREYGPRSEHVLDVYPDAHRVRLDVGTGVCVSTEAIGGPEPGVLHDVRIEAVDEPMDDALFVAPRRGLFR
jgi:hypothetical protein